MGEQIVLGLGNNIDYEIVWDSQVLERLIIEFNIRDSEICTDIRILSIRNLVVSILGFLKSESGGEHFVTSLEIILDFASHFQKKITMGGTSLRAAIAMRKIGYNSALHLVTRLLFHLHSPCGTYKPDSTVYAYLVSSLLCCFQMVSRAYILFNEYLSLIG